MAKVTAPLFSFSASGKIADSLVYFPWKGLKCVRQYVIPTNPRSDAQNTHRAYMTTGVAAIHAAMVLAASALASPDKSAYSLLGSLKATPRTWFNTAIRLWINQYVAGEQGVIYHGGGVFEGDAECIIDVHFTDAGGQVVSDGDFWYGISPSALLSSEPGVIVVAGHMRATVAGLVNGTKYYFQFRPTLHAGFVGADSGIYHGTPSA